MRIGIITRAKQGDITEALEKRGWTQKQGADFLGIHQNTLSKLINLRWAPKEFSVELEVKLYELTGKTLEELFPDWARQKDFLDMPKVSKKFVEVTPLMLQGTWAMPCLPPTPEEIFSKQELRKTIDEALLTLSPRQEKVLREHIMDGETLEEVGRSIGVSRERVRQDVIKACEKFRRPDRARMFRQFLRA